MFSFTLAAIAVLINLLLVSAHKRGLEDKAHRVNDIVCWFYPSAFAFGTIVIYCSFFH